MKTSRIFAVLVGSLISTSASAQKFNGVVVFDVACVQAEMRSCIEMSANDCLTNTLTRQPSCHKKVYLPQEVDAEVVKLNQTIKQQRAELDGIIQNLEARARLREAELCRRLSQKPESCLTPIPDGDSKK